MPGSLCVQIFAQHICFLLASRNFLWISFHQILELIGSGNLLRPVTMVGSYLAVYIWIGYLGLLQLTFDKVSPIVLFLNMASVCCIHIFVEHYGCRSQFCLCVFARIWQSPGARKAFGCNGLALFTFADNGRCAVSLAGDATHIFVADTWG